MNLLFRLSQRDHAVDIARIKAVKAAASAALFSVKCESVDLKKRINDLTFSLATVLGDEDGIYFEREPQAEKELTLLERQLLEAEKRSATLDRQLEILVEVDRLLEDMTGSATAT